MKLGECINNYLNEHDMSMRKFATLAGVSHAYISYLISGQTPRGKTPVPTITVYKGIAKAMGIDVNTLVSMVDDEIAWGEQKNPATVTDYEILEETTSTVKECNNIMRTLNQENQKFALDFLKKLASSQQIQDE